VKLSTKKWRVALLIIVFTSMQWLVAMHRVAHVHGPVAGAVFLDHHDHDAAHSATGHSDAHSQSHSHSESITSGASNAFPGHLTKADCDRFDACAGSDLFVVRLKVNQIVPPQRTQINRIDAAFVAARTFRAKARSPPAPSA
jgi:hypothetical protein